MEYSPVSKKQAVAMLRVWQQAGHELPSLAKFSTEKEGNSIIVLIPGYRCNKWYQVGDRFTAYQEAMASIGALLDETKATK
ncbi:MULTISPECIES: hypothetical protein [unclassified Arsukibacterium]|uniref:hypothetical protein n=1 Tax=unclassified Arsukibacterium TaxID=2635278 RepID=UPI000C63B8A1|nr:MULTISPECIES: hypothetical protein [unclassified Arsukibacterium]MAA93666.1 hypothetical protein [Rheinheimera sp.]MBM33050.1 hypothetical protein [Rheinheimera sp.]HAW93055.1 hypothetical protein [Candidatus Azambacteria bacterium]|tara:strand:+ start:175 stop:417 length:243 start_codon:yes stop_codon:yes gene_type:complete